MYVNSTYLSIYLSLHKIDRFKCFPWFTLHRKASKDSNYFSFLLACVCWNMR